MVLAERKNRDGNDPCLPLVTAYSSKLVSTFNIKVNLYQLLTEIKFESEKLSNSICHFSSALKVVM